MATTSPAALGGRELPFWLCILLGIVLVIAGVVVLGDVVLATLVRAFVIGLCLIVGGAFGIVHAFWTKGWGGSSGKFFSVFSISQPDWFSLRSR